MKRTLWAISVILLGTSLILAGCKGKEGPAGAPGTGPVTTPLCASPTTLGYTGTEGADSVVAGRMLAYAVNITTPTTAISLGIKLAGGPIAGQYRMGLYNDTGANYPNNLILETGPRTPVVNAVNTIDISDVYLPAGTYWIALVYSNTVSNAEYFSNSGGSFAWADYGWSALPFQFPAGTTNSCRIGLIVNTCP